MADIGEIFNNIAVAKSRFDATVITDLTMLSRPSPENEWLSWRKDVKSKESEN